MLDKIIQWIGFSFFGGAIWLVFKEVHHVGIEYLGRLVLETPISIIGMSLFFVFVDYLVLIAYDGVALYYVGKRVPLPTMLEAAGIGFAVSNTAGHAYLAGGSIRYLFYVPAGLTKAQVLEVIAFESLTIFMGMALAFIVAVGVVPFESVLGNYTHVRMLYGSAVAVVIGIVLYWMFIIQKQKKMKIGKYIIQAPSKRMTLLQFCIGLLDNIFIFLCFYSLLNYHIETSIVLSFVVFIIAQTIGLASQVPGGVGVFEGLFLLLFPYASEQKGSVLASLVTFRAVYFFLPFVLAIIYLSMRGFKRRILRRVV